MPVTLLYKCKRCKREFNFNNIKYDKDGTLICVECLEKKKKLEKKEVALEKLVEHKTINLICMNCRFKFSVRKGSPKALKCPYCSKTKLMIVKKYKDENDLIKDSMDTRFDY